MKLVQRIIGRLSRVHSRLAQQRQFSIDYMEGAGTPTFIMAELACALVAHWQEFSAQQLTKIAGHLEQAMCSGESETLEAVGAGFLQSLLHFAEPGMRYDALLHRLSASSRAYVDGCDRGRGVEPRSWPQQIVDPPQIEIMTPAEEAIEKFCAIHPSLEASRQESIDFMEEALPFSILTGFADPILENYQILTDAHLNEFTRLIEWGASHQDEELGTIITTGLIEALVHRTDGKTGYDALFGRFGRESRRYADAWDAFCGCKPRLWPQR